MTDTKRRRRPQKVKGVVLVMVVTLLFILVVMLMATLTVVGNANKRTVTKFEENQAYYTARSALDVYIKGMLEMDETADLGETGAKRAGKALGNKFKDISESNLAAFYKNKTDASGGYANFGGNPIVEGFVYQQEIFGYLTPKYKLKNIKRGEVLAAPNDDSNWTETETWDSKPESQQNYRVTYKAKLPNVNSVTGMASNDNVGIMASEDVDITVELLRMAYMTKDDYLITDGTLGVSGTAGGPGTVVDSNIAEVDWTKTYYRLKVTSTAKIKQGTGGVNEGTVSVILEPKVVNSPSAFTNALTTFEKTTMSTKGFTVGGASAALPDGETGPYNAANNSTWAGSYVYRYDVVANATSGFTWRLFDNDSFVVQKGYLHIQNGTDVEGHGNINASSDELDKRPYIYAGGVFLHDTNMKVGTNNSSCVDLVLYSDPDFGKYGVGGSEWWTPDPPRSNIDAAVNDTNGVGDPSRVAFFASGPTNTYDFYGDVYCDGDMYISHDTKFHGNVFCTGNIFVRGDSRNDDGSPKNNWCFEKDVKVGGKIMNASGLEIYSASKVSGALSVSDATMLGYVGDSCPWGNNWDSNIDEIPEIGFGGLTSRKDVQVKTVKKITETYRDSVTQDIIPADEFIMKQTKQTDIKLYVKNNAKDIKLDAVPTINKDFTINGSTVSLSNVMDPTDPNVATYNSSTDFYEMKITGSNQPNNLNGVLYLDATQGNVQVQLSGEIQNANHPKIIVLGDNDVIFSIADNDGFKGNLSILSYDIYQMLQSSATFNLGDPDTVKAAGLEYPKAPKIYYYIGKNSTLDMYNADGDTWAGYMYGPEAKFNTNAGGIGKTINYTYDGNPSGSNFTQTSVYCYGSMVFESISAQNDVGVAFIDPGNDGGGAPAQDKVIWSRQRFLNR